MARAGAAGTSSGSRPLSVVLAGGGSGGHVIPLLALADCLCREDPLTQIVALGTTEGLESRLVPERGYRLAVVPKVPLPRRPSVDLVRLPGRLGGAVSAAQGVIRGTDVVVGFGGYVSAPAYLAAKRARVPIVVHEANARPGFANRLGARLTPYVAVATQGTPLARARHLGMPLRTAITGLDRLARRAEARAAFGLHPDRRTLLVTGGSLGAQRLNETFGALAEDLGAADIQVLHVAGAGKAVPGVADRPGDGSACADRARVDRSGENGRPPYVVVPFVDRMELAFAAADLVVCRGGANTVAEVTAVGLPAVYVPLPVGNGEQRLNAEPVVAAGGGLLVDDAALTTEWVRRAVIELVRDDVRLEAMAAASARHGVKDGDVRLAALVREAASARKPASARGLT